MKKAALALLLLPLLASCGHLATRTAAHVDLDRFRHVYVEHLLTDGRGIDELIARELRQRGYQASAGPLQLMPGDTEIIVSYSDRWTFDFTEYLLRIEMQVHTNHTGRLIAEGYFERPSVTGNAPVEMIDHVLDKLFKTRGPAVPPPPPYPGPESTAPTS